MNLHYYQPLSALDVVPFVWLKVCTTLGGIIVWSLYSEPWLLSGAEHVRRSTLCITEGVDSFGEHYCAVSMQRTSIITRRWQLWATLLWGLSAPNLDYYQALSALDLVLFVWPCRCGQFWATILWGLYAANLYYFQALTTLGDIIMRSLCSEPWLIPGAECIRRSTLCMTEGAPLLCSLYAVNLDYYQALSALDVVSLYVESLGDIYRVVSTYHTALSVLECHQNHQTTELLLHKRICYNAGK